MAVLERAGVRPDDPDVDPALALETTDEAASPADPRLDVFRDFMNSLDIGGEPETREGPNPD